MASRMDRLLVRSDYSFLCFVSINTGRWLLNVYHLIWLPFMLNNSYVVTLIDPFEHGYQVYSAVDDGGLGSSTNKPACSFIKTIPQICKIVSQLRENQS